MQDKFWHFGIKARVHHAAGVVARSALADLSDTVAAAARYALKF